MASAGAIPGHQDALRGRCGALGFNINIPVFNRTEAELRAQAAAKDLKETENRIARALA